jgi:hypothetical protein
MLQLTAQPPHGALAHQSKPRRRSSSYTSGVEFLAYSLDRDSSILADYVTDLRANEGDVIRDVTTANTGLLELFGGGDWAGVARTGAGLTEVSAR